MPERRPPTQILRIAGWLEEEGSALEAVSLAVRLDPYGYRTVLMAGESERGDGGPAAGPAESAIVPVRIESLRRRPGPRDLAALGEIAGAVRRLRPQIVHTHGSRAGGLGRLAGRLATRGAGGRPVVVHSHDVSLTPATGARALTSPPRALVSGRRALVSGPRALLSGPRALVSGPGALARAAGQRRIERALGPLTTAFVVPSAELGEELLAHGIAGTDRVTVVPPGLELSRFLDDSRRANRRATVRAELGIDPGAEVVLHVGRLVRGAGTERFLEVAGRVAAARPATRFLIVGEGEDRAALERSRAARALGPRLFWAGRQTEMPAVCAAADAFVLASRSASPRHLIEAQASAVAVVALDGPGSRSVAIDGETALFARPGDTAGLAAAVVRVLGERGLAARLARAGRRHAIASHSIERWLKDHDLLYRRLLEASRDRDDGSRPVG